MQSRSVVIVGAGHAGARAAQALSAGGFPGMITIVSAEKGVPYERPPVSKALLFGDGGTQPLWQSDAAAMGLTVVAGRVQAIDRESHAVVLGDGARLSYSRLILATGARPRRIPGTPAQGRILYLRTAADAGRLRPLLGRGARLLIVGAGLIGLEVAAGAARSGVEVTVVEMAPRALGRAVPAVIAEAVVAAHAEHGVRLRTAIGVDRLSESGETVRVRLSDGTEERFDVALIAAGVVPRTELAEAGGLALDNGIVADAMLTSSDPDIFAAGDVARFVHPLFGTAMRLESQQNADEQGRYVARRILGEITVPFDAVPWFWSDQYTSVLQVAGVPALGVQTIERPIEGGRLSFHLNSAGVLYGAAAVGPQSSVAREIGAARRLIAQGARLDPEAVRNPAYDLREALRIPLTAQD